MRCAKAPSPWHSNIAMTSQAKPVYNFYAYLVNSPISCLRWDVSAENSVLCNVEIAPFPLADWFVYIGHIQPCQKYTKPSKRDRGINWIGSVWRNTLNGRSLVVSDQRWLVGWTVQWSVLKRVLGGSLVRRDEVDGDLPTLQKRCARLTSRRACLKLSLQLIK